MRSVILVAVVLQLAVIITHSTGAPLQAAEQHNYTFGDIIAFPRRCIGTTPSFIHFGVYVGPAGDGNPDVGQGDNDVFHFSGEHKLKNSSAECKFDKLSKIRKERYDVDFNYLDDIPDFTLRSPEQMVKEIRRMTGNCRRFMVSDSKHLVTSLRYHDFPFHRGAKKASWDRATALVEALKKAKDNEDCMPLRTKRAS